MIELFDRMAIFLYNRGVDTGDLMEAACVCAIVACLIGLWLVWPNKEED